MATKASFLSTTYGAYHHSDVPREDEELTHVGPSTPCGEYLRRFWHPVALSSDLKDLPVPIRILGEDLVVFRDGTGRLGLLELHCTHRGTSLEFGIICETGIRCCYHGWRYDVDGRILETPDEPPDSTLKDRLCQGAYPVHEFGGTIFAYMGPPDKVPPFPLYDRFATPGYYAVPGKTRFTPCNWLQMQDNAVDPIHVKWLHTLSSGAQFKNRPGNAEMGETDFMETNTGFVSVRSKRVGENIWVSMVDIMAPNVRHIPSSWETGEGDEHVLRSAGARWNVPVDDTSSIGFSLSYIREGEEGKLGNVADEGRVDQPYAGADQRRPYEDQQRHPNDFEAQVSQRPIAVHALEHLATIDQGVIMFRNLVRQGIKAVQNGENPKYLHLKEGGLVPTISGHTVMRIPPAATPEEDIQLLRDTGRRLAEQYIKDPSSFILD